MIYLLLFSPTDEAGRQAAIDAQRLRNAYSPRDFALIYLPLPGTDQSLWPEIATRYNLAGDHLLLTDAQLIDAVDRLRSDDDLSGTVINRTGKIVKRNAPLPGAFDEVKEANRQKFISWYLIARIDPASKPEPPLRLRPVQVRAG